MGWKVHVGHVTGSILDFHFQIPPTRIVMFFLLTLN